ncbi:MAG: glucose-1-phosphate adenylyltransferase subunit GlgD [Lachnospiraceae bacterium]|nr:glucose-1-phosphate adenylyltransferase subunit GlgD [Lachnospiraceae bacterium]MDD3615717.1 glucose-1-phosphate adenylyltransferase subunit GlgD [Lachnospiraceae bacterium]
MYSAFGIVNPSGRQFWVEGLEDYRPIGAISFMGRYRVIDFPISNLSNSGIDRIQVYIKRKPMSLTDHLGTGRHYNINSKRGRLQILFSENTAEHDIYNTDIASYIDNMESIKRMHHPYVVIAPSYMVYKADYSALIANHVESGADITMMYHSVDNAKENHLNCNVLNLNRQKGVLSIEPNHGTAKSRNIFMDTYVMKTELFIDLVQKAKAVSSMYTMADIINDSCSELDIRGVAHRGFFATITDFESYYNANMSLINIKTAMELFNEDWPIYTRTNDSCPTQYFENADVKKSVVSNGCLIEGSVENSIIGRGCVIKKDAVVKNSIVLAGAVVGEGVHVENQVVDKRAQLIHVKEVVAAPDKPGYIRREDTL